MGYNSLPAFTRRTYVASMRHFGGDLPAMSDPYPSTSTASTDAVAAACLRTAIENERAYLTAYEQPSEPITYEVLRTLDDIFCRDLMEPTRAIAQDERLFKTISSWGVNHALRRVIPLSPANGPFRDFPSTAATQDRANDFIVHCGALAVGERLLGWLEEGLLTGEVRPYPNEFKDHILVLRDSADSCHDEEIGRAGMRWASDLVWQEGLGAEVALEERYRDIAPELEQRAKLEGDWRITYSTTPEIDAYFAEWGRHYLRRIFSQDLIGDDDSIGGRPFSRYLDVLSALSGRSQKHLAFAAVALGRHPSVHIRNLLATPYPRVEFINSLAEYMKADRDEISSILTSLVLSGDNLEVHTRGGDVAWAPIVQASSDWLILPNFGIDINPFLFLLTDLRFRYETDWFRIANNRERRWIDELQDIFARYRWWTHRRNIQIRDEGRVVTDIDFAAYDVGSNELCLFQLKWQHPVGMDNRARHSAGKNLVQECDRWISAISSWLERHCTSDLMKRMGIECPEPPTVRLFVLARYHAHFSGFGSRDNRAAWATWAYFRRVCAENPESLTAEELESQMRSQIASAHTTKRRESTMFPVGNIAIVLNPSLTPETK